VRLGLRHAAVSPVGAANLPTVARLARALSSARLSWRTSARIFSQRRRGLVNYFEDASNFECCDHDLRSFSFPIIRENAAGSRPRQTGHPRLSAAQRRGRSHFPRGADRVCRTAPCQLVAIRACRNAGDRTGFVVREACVPPCCAPAARQHSRAPIKLALRQAAPAMSFHLSSPYWLPQNFFDIVRQAAGLIRICNRVTKLNDFRRRPEAGATGAPIIDRKLGECRRKFDHREAITVRLSHSCSFPFLCRQPLRGFEFCKVLVLDTVREIRVVCRAV